MKKSSSSVVEGGGRGSGSGGIGRVGNVDIDDRGTINDVLPLGAAVISTATAYTYNSAIDSINDNNIMENHVTLTTKYESNNISISNSNSARSLYENDGDVVSALEILNNFDASQNSNNQNEPHHATNNDGWNTHCSHKNESMVPSSANEAISHHDDVKPVLGVEGNESSAAASKASAASISASSMDRNHNLALFSYLSSLGTIQNCNTTNEPNESANATTTTTTTTTDSPYTCNNDQDPNTLFQIQLETMYTKELEKEHDRKEEEEKKQNTKISNTTNHDTEKDRNPNPSSTCNQSYDQSILRRMILGHNLGLNYLITNKPDRGVDILLPIFESFQIMVQSSETRTEGGFDDGHENKNDKSTNSNIDQNFKLGDVKCKIAFLLLDCILATNQVSLFKPVLQWIEKYITWSIKNNNNSINSINSITTNTSKRGRENDDPSTITSLKFRLHCYKSKCLFLQSKYDEMTVREANTRVAKKELKSAMEIYHHKLAKNVWTQTNSKNSVGGGTALSGGGGGGTALSGGGGLGEGGESTLVDEGASIQESIALSIGSMSHDPLQDNHNPNNTIHSSSSNPNNNAGTVASSTQNHLVGGGPASRTTTTVTEYRTQFQTKRLHRQNQSALYLKANLEHLKGNTKKSLKLCSEAQNCGVRQRDSTATAPFHHTTSSSQQSQIGGDGGNGSREKFKSNEESQWSSDVQYAHHFNNLAIIHQVAGKLHLAMHYYSISLGHIEKIEQNVNPMIVEGDGIASPIPLSQILFNASICAQQLSNFSTAHECMKRCVASSPNTFGKDPFCWFHMGESCINSHVTMKRKNRKNSVMR